MEKHEPKNGIHNQPDASKLDDTMYKEYVNQKIDKGLEDIERGAVFTQEEARIYLQNKRSQSQTR